ncbi:MAG: hypothetical protein GY743_12365 [Planctomycetaceae bacterium]|nr:hypothetical protein [Planctomycetaceae bacterium]
MRLEKFTSSTDPKKTKKRNSSKISPAVCCAAGTIVRKAENLARTGLPRQKNTNRPALATMLHVNKNQLGLTYQSLTGS